MWSGAAFKVFQECGNFKLISHERNAKNVKKNAFHYFPQPKVTSLDVLFYPIHTHYSKYVLFAIIQLKSGKNKYYNQSEKSLHLWGGIKECCHCLDMDTWILEILVNTTDIVIVALTVWDSPIQKSDFI